jgi:transposase
VIRETFGWKSLSLIGAISLWRILFRIHPGAIKGPQVVDFLKVLRRHMPQPFMVIWDGAPIHRSKVVSDYVASTNGHIVIERLPAYAPELNPAEYIWAHLKQHEIGNLLVKEAWQLRHYASVALKRMRRRPRIIRACFSQASLWPE